MKTRLISFILSLIFHSSFSYVIYLSSHNNQPGGVIFNCSLGSNLIYSLSTQLSPIYSQNFIDISRWLSLSHDGLVYLKKSLKCSSLNYEEVVPRPLSAFVTGNTSEESLKSQKKLIIIPLLIYFDHFTCNLLNLFNLQKHNNITSFNQNSFHSFIFPSSALVLRSLHKSSFYCFKRSQHITSLNQFIPTAIHKDCNIKFKTFSNCSHNLCSNFAVKHSSSDLIALFDFCVPSNQFKISLELLLECPIINDFQTRSHRLNQGLVLSSIEYLDIIFNPENLGHENFIEIKKEKYKLRKRRQFSNSAPFFDKSLYIVNVPEEKEKGFTVSKMTATDPDNGEILYSMSAILDARSQSMFSIDSLSGVITTTTRLDREFMDLHYLRIVAVNSGLPPQTGTTTLQINVEDENDHAPVFERASYEANVKESIPIGSIILSVRASDQDVENNAKIEYNIVNPTGPNEAFRIDSQTGVITTRAPLDRETVSSYLLTIQASDLAAPNFRKHTEINVRISLIDENDNYPQFLNRSYSTSVSEDIPWSHHPIIASVTATDADEDLNAVIKYSIIGGNTQGHFQMNSLTGEISVIAPLNYESTRNYRLTIRAQDAGSPPRSNTTRMLINVEDVNDNDPKFYNSLFQETVIENTPIGHSILRVQAYDDDDAQNAAITYSIKNYEKLNIPLAINNETGWITTTKELDWEEANLYEFTVIAKDNGQPSRFSSASVIIRVQDTNDNDPTFDPKIYEVAVSEIDQVGTLVARVTATDKDENSRLIFQITNGNNKGRFNIVSQKNQGIISIAQPLDYKLEKRYMLSILVTDNGGRTDIATVYVNVTDANTHRPVIEKTPYAISLPEDTLIGSTVVVIEASDADVGENARITFQMEETSEFKIDPITGAITTTQKLDRELVAGYTIVVTASDNGVPPLTDTTNVEIEVIDVNDNAPKFKQESYQASISEESIIGTSVQQIFATDNDVGLNGQIRYTFEDGYDGDYSFVIDQTSGMIRTNKMLDRESTSKYELIAYAVDSGTPALSSSVFITVIVEDVNDNPPRFDSDQLKFYIPENSPIGTVVGELKATDPDEGQNAKIEYAIVGGSDSNSFQLISRNHDKAEIITKIELDFELQKKVYHLIVRASSLPLRTDVDIEIFVTDVNDNAPILKDFLIIFNNYKNYFPLQSIGKVPVYEADVLDQLHFKFLSGNRANLLIINETSGDIRLNPSLNTNVPTRALFEISVSDGLNEASALCQLSVNLVTETMLFNSVTIRLNNIKYNHFLSFLFEQFLDGLSSIIPCSKENIIILNIQDGKEVGAQVLNISFSARIQDSRNLDSFYSSQYLKERIYLSRPLLTKITGLEILPFDDNLCVHEPCLNFEKCLSILKFGNASDFISSETILFRPINPINTYACRCPYGFTGMFHKDDCDTEINLCFSSPCLNGGTCLQHESGYTCLCPNGFMGENCKTNLSFDLCQEGFCKSNSECVNLKKNKTDSSEQFFQGFECVNCTYSQWSTPFCDLRTRSFSKESYITFSSLQQRHRFKIKLSFATRNDNSLLFYNGRYNEKHDFVSLEIIDSKLVFSFSLGSSPHQLILNTPEGYLTNGQWHTVEVSYFNRTSKIQLINCDEKMIKSSKFEKVLVYVCSNQTTSNLDARCQDKMQTCYRFLDLTGPFQLGGLPPLPSKFQISTSSFIGCISDFFIDDKMIDLNSYVANNGTIPGCIEKRAFCHSQPCQNGGTCIEGWGSFNCQCKNGFLGQDCSETQVRIKSFKGDGFLVFSPRLRPISVPWLVKISFKTIQDKGLLLRMQLGQKSFVVIDIINGNLRYTFDSQSLIIGPVKVNDGQWHFFEVSWMSNGILFNLNYGQYEANQDFAGDIRGLYISEVSVGGLDNTGDDTQETEYPYFVGCIQGLDVDNSKNAWLNFSNERNVYEDCLYENLCHSNPCPFQAQCIDEGLGRYSCKCNLGYVGSDCVFACELNPCYHGSQCIPANNTRGYTCKCNEYYTGLNCEIKIQERCPSNWWGYPICGPCNCDSSHGYDGNCNQTTGECICGMNHFQPSGSNFCYDCDCYALGSYSNRCDPLNGQCKCRPGVIGRKCDSCASPLAEVTLRGCEVIYDGCPRSFSDGIWWERTPYGTLSNQSCPYGSFGKASRYCDEIHGWQSSDLFECTSNIFTDLADKLVLLDQDMFPLTTYLSIKIANDLKNSLNQSKTLYGNDAMITYRLLYHLIDHELKQSGLNLTHKQDRYFLTNLIEIASYILDLKHLKYWNKILSATNSGVPEHILQLFTAYAEVLIKNKEDTFTEPFEISFQNMIFGLDTVGIDELWDLSKISSLNSSKLKDVWPSVYLNFSSSSGPAVKIPKYNNYPQKKNNMDDLTQLILPLKILGLKPISNSSDIKESKSLSMATSFYSKAYISYAIYPTLGHLLPLNHDSSIQHRFGISFQINTPILSINIKPAKPRLSKRLAYKSSFDKFLNPKIGIRFRTLSEDGFTNPQCGYWSFISLSSDKSRPKKGKWSSRGCELTGTYPAQKLRKSYTYINCSCDRLAAFGVFMDVTSSNIFIEESFALSIFTLIVIITSLLLLILTLVLLSAIRGVQTNSNSIHRNIVLSVFCSIFLFGIALKFRNILTQKGFPCTMIAIFLHYFFLCNFSWIFVESIHLYRMLVEIRDINHGPMRFYYFVGYAVPAIAVGLSVGVKADQYGHYLFCWLSIYESVIWSMLGPISIFSILSVFIFTMALRASIQIKETVSDYGNLKTLLWLSMILLPILGSTWVFALLSSNDTYEEINYVFVSLCIISSLYIFIGYCIVNRRVRHNLKITWYRLKGIKIGHLEESLSGTRISIASKSANPLQSNFDILVGRGFGVSTCSTTSRSTATKTSSSPYRSDCQNSSLNTHNYKRHKKSSRDKKHKTSFESESELSYSQPSLDLASSHSSDEDEANISTSEQNQINIMKQQSMTNGLSENKSLPSVEELNRGSNNYIKRAANWNSGISIGNIGSLAMNIANSYQEKIDPDRLAEISYMPYSRSNILAMKLEGDNIIEKLNQISFSNNLNEENIKIKSEQIVDPSYSESILFQNVQTLNNDSLTDLPRDQVNLVDSKNQIENNKQDILIEKENNDKKSEKLKSISQDLKEKTERKDDDVDNVERVDSIDEDDEENCEKKDSKDFTKSKFLKESESEV